MLKNDFAFYFSASLAKIIHIFTNKGAFMEEKRFVAVFIDFIIAAATNIIPFSLLVMLPMIQGNGQMQPPELMARALGASLIAMLYLVFRDIPSGGSIGKKVMKLKIVDTETQGPVSTGRRILRNVTWLLSWIEIFAYLITKKRIGDRIAKTIVVEKTPRTGR